jgi:non-homologous end joining protein Ku
MLAGELRQRAVVWIRPYRKVLVLHTIYLADEVRDLSKAEDAKVNVS